MKITKIAEGAYFVPSYSDQTIVRAYSTETTVQSFGYGGDALDVSDASEVRAPEGGPGSCPQPHSAGAPLGLSPGQNLIQPIVSRLKPRFNRACPSSPASKKSRLQRCAPLAFAAS